MILLIIRSFNELIDGTINFMEYAKEENEDYLKFTKDQLEQKNRNNVAY